jgi:hypothetical protein
MITVDEVRELARGLPRSAEVFVRDRIKFRVGRIVWLAFSRDGSEIGFAFPKEWRPALVESEPEKFMLPAPSDLKYNWVEARLDALDPDEIRELVLEAWSLVVSKYVVDEYLARRVSFEPDRTG